MRRLLAPLCVWSFATAFGMTTIASADDWPTFRGPNGAGISNDKNLPSEWSAEKNVAWKTKVGGRGWSCPIVFKDRVYVTSASSELDGRAREGGRPGGPGGGRPGGGFGGAKPPEVPFKFEVHCLDLATGKEIWKRTAREDKPKIATHGSNTYATETPVIDDNRLYAYFGMHGIYCFDLDGKQLWTKDLGSFPMMAGWGTAASPAAHDGRVFVQVDNDEKSFIVALDGKTGEQAWRAERAERTGWSSPVIWKNKVRTELVTMGAQKARSYDPSTGKVLWELNVGGGRSSASPVGDDEHAYVGLDSGGSGRPGGPRPGGAGETPPVRPGGAGGPPMGRGGNGGLFAVKAGASGDITPKMGETTSEGVTWSRAKAGPQMASPVVYQGNLYIFSQNGGLVSCYDAKTGKPHYEKERLEGARTFWSSPWAADGKIFCLDDSGNTHIIKAGPTFSVVGKNSINDTTWATPGLANGTLLIRGSSTMYAIRK